MVVVMWYSFRTSYLSDWIFRLFIMRIFLTIRTIKKVYIYTYIHHRFKFTREARVTFTVHENWQKFITHLINAKKIAISVSRAPLSDVQCFVDHSYSVGNFRRSRSLLSYYVLASLRLCRKRRFSARAVRYTKTLRKCFVFCIYNIYIYILYGECFWSI